ncbi:MAG: glutathione S-transferase family protein [Leptospira sp.]|nr:glutathione S-transferase family protein [Leptospira sp.]
MKVFGDKQSGNCYKIILTSSILNLDIEWVDIDILKSETKADNFLKMNPNGKVPILEISQDKYLSESNAIINYLAFGSKLIPKDKYEYHKMLEWQFFEQYSHEPYIAVARFINKYLGLPTERKNEYESKKIGGYKALDVMEEGLSINAFLVGETVTLADISLYAYTHVADEGGFDLSNFPSINSWLRRIQSIPGYSAM